MATSLSSLQLPPVFGTLQLPLLLATNVLALAIGPRYRFLQLGFSLPVWTLLAAQSRYRDYSGAWGIHYAVNCGILSLLATYVDWVLLKSADREGWTKLSSRVGAVQRSTNEDELKNSETVGDDDFPKDDGGVVKSNGAAASKSTAKITAPIGFRSRLWWAIRLACTNRYTCWSCEVKNVPFEVDDDYPRWWVFLALSLHSSWLFFILDGFPQYPHD